MSQEKLEKTFNVSGGARLKLSNIRGSVDVRPGTENVIQVTVIKHTDRGDAGSTEIELTQAGDGTVIAATRFPDGWWLWLIGSMPCPVDYIVKMPQNSTLELKGVSNKVFVDGLNGDFDINTVSGDLTLQNLTGPLNIHSVSGGVSASHLSGPLKLKTVSGDVDVREAQLTAISAQTTSGHLKFQTALSAGPYSLHSVSGNVTFTLPAGTPCSLDLESVSGRISTPFTQDVHSHPLNAQGVNLAGGGARLSMHSISGNLRVYMDGKAQPANSGAGISSPNRLAILERIARGELSPDEAVVQLKG